MSLTFKTEKIFALDNDILKFILETYIELLDRDLAGMGIPFQNTDDVLLASDESGSVVGYIVVRKAESAIPAYVIVMAAVRPEHRGKGIHSQMHKRLDAIARAHGIKYISSYVSTKNEEVLRSYEKIGDRQVVLKINRKVT